MGPKESYGDVRDLLLKLPHGDIHGNGSYAWNSDIFTVRWEIINELGRHELGRHVSSVFEYGALYGYFLVTALSASSNIRRVGWVDNEQHTANSNQIVAHNLADVIAKFEQERVGYFVDWPRFYRHRDQLHEDVFRLGLQYDLVSVDAGHSYDECLADLHSAHRLRPRWIMVDDWTAETHTDDVQGATRAFLAERPEYELSGEYDTVNGLAVLTRKT
jgi:hypothetical protein